MEVNNMEVDFETYCKTCKHKDIKEVMDPCNECLAVGCRESSRIPENWESKN